MRKVLLYIGAAFGIFLLSSSDNKSLMEWWADFRVDKLQWYFTSVRHGDLFSNCFLPGFTDTAYIPMKKYPEEQSNTDLYIIHDSYLADKVGKENFKNIDKLFMSDLRGQGRTVHPDTNKRNILILELAERSIWRILDTNSLYVTFRQGGVPISRRKIESKNESWLISGWLNPNLEKNLEFNLFDYELLIPLKSAKAWMNYYGLGKVSGDVQVSRSGKYLLLDETVNPQSVSSSFYPHAPDWATFFISKFNRFRDIYLKEGFDEVYFSIIPNPADIVDPGRGTYNNAIIDLESHPQRTIPFIDVFNTFKSTRKHIFLRDDTHWNGNGLQIWVDEVNRSILLR